MSTKPMKVEITSHDGKLLGSIDFDGSEGFKVAIFENLPERSPLHRRALNINDLKVGMVIACRNSSGIFSKTACIAGEPFRRGTKYHDSWDTQGDSWMVPVATISHAG